MHRYVMAVSALLFFIGCGFSAQAETNITALANPAGSEKPTYQITGNLKYHRNMEGPGILPRDVLVWLPPSYDSNATSRYPVLYMHDGQQVFDPATSTHGIDWQIDETATRLIREGKMQEIIVVASYCTADRDQEYDDTEKGRAYMDFVVKILKPFVDKTYRTRPEREHTAVMGASMGGRISLLLAWKHPEVFSMAGCLSSAFYGDMPRQVEQGPAFRRDLRLYLDNGGIGLDHRLQPGNDWMLEVLLKKGFKLGQNLLWMQDKNADHNEEAWAKRAWRPLLYFFGIGEQAWSRDLPAPPEPIYANRDKQPKPRVRVDGFKAVGMEVDCEFHQLAEKMQSTWEEFIRREPKLGLAGAPAYVGMCTSLDPNRDKFRYFAGVRVPDSASIPEGLCARDLAPREYVIIKDRGNVEQSRETLDYIFNWWLLRSNDDLDGPIVQIFKGPPTKKDIAAEIRVPLKNRIATK